MRPKSPVVLRPAIQKPEPAQSRDKIGRYETPSAAGAIQAPRAKPRKPALSPAAARQLEQFPVFPPLLEEIEVAGWSSHRRRLSGNFHDWQLLHDGRLLVAIGQAVGHGRRDPMEAALVAQSAGTAIRAHAIHARDAGTLLSLAARTLWPIPSANVLAEVAVALVDPDGGNVSLAIAGDPLAWRVRAASSEQLLGNQPLLGTGTDVSYRELRFELALRERLLLVADDPLRRSRKLLAAIATSFTHSDAESHRSMTAADAVSLVRNSYEVAAAADPLTSASIVAVRRR